MASTPGSTKTRNILLGRSGSDDSLGQLAEGLRGQGFTVAVNHTSPVGAHDTNDAVKHTLRDVDLVLLVVRGDDARGGSGPPFDRVLHDASMIQNSIGDGGLLLLVEESVVGLPDTGLDHIRFPTSRADRILDDLVTRIGPGPEAAEEPERDLHARVPMGEQARSRALRVPWLLVFVVLLSAAIPLLLALSSFRGSDDSNDETVVTLTDVASGLAIQRTRQTTPPLVDAQGAELTGPAGAVVAGTPASPAMVGGDNSLLPAVCEVDLRKGLEVLDMQACSGVGRLVAEGTPDGWHNGLGAVVVAEGVVAELYMETRSDGTTNGPPVVTVASGQAVAVNEFDAAYGAERLILRFSGNNQHVHLFRNRDGTGEEVTLMFLLDG